MSRNANSGIFQLENGHWGYRFIITVDGKRKAQKRTRDELGNSFKTEKQAMKARHLMVIFGVTKMSTLQSYSNAIVVFS